MFRSKSYCISGIDIMFSYLYSRMDPTESINIDELVKTTALDFPFEKEQTRQMIDTISSHDIDYRDLRVNHTTVYENENEVEKPKKHILVTAVFSNNTNSPQEYTFNTTRRTKSSCALTITKGYTISVHANIHLKIGPPNLVVDANTGFKEDISMSTCKAVTYEEELTLTVDSKVQVPQMKKTMAELVVKEGQYDSKFHVRTDFSGEVHVTLRNKKDNNELLTVNVYAKDIFTKQNGFFPTEEGDAYGITEGMCNCTYGIEQQVKLTESELDPEEPEKNENTEVDDVKTELDPETKDGITDVVED